MTRSDVRMALSLPPPLSSGRRHPLAAAALCPDGGDAGVRSDTPARLRVRRLRTADPGAFASTPGPRNRWPRRPRSRRSRSGSSAPTAEDRRPSSASWGDRGAAVAGIGTVLAAVGTTVGAGNGTAAEPARVWEPENARRRARGLICQRRLVTSPPTPIRDRIARRGFDRICPRRTGRGRGRRRTPGGRSIVLV